MCYVCTLEPTLSANTAVAIAALLVLLLVLVQLLCCLPLTLSKPPGKGRQRISQSNRPLLQRRSQNSLVRRVVDVHSRTRRQTHYRLAYSTIGLLHLEIRACVCAASCNRVCNACGGGSSSKDDVGVSGGFTSAASASSGRLAAMCVLASPERRRRQQYFSAARVRIVNFPRTLSAGSPPIHRGHLGPY